MGSFSKTRKSTVRTFSRLSKTWRGKNRRRKRDWSENSLLSRLLEEMALQELAQKIQSHTTLRSWLQWLKSAFLRTQDFELVLQALTRCEILKLSHLVIKTRKWSLIVLQIKACWNLTWSSRKDPTWSQMKASTLQEGTMMLSSVKQWTWRASQCCSQRCKRLMTLISVKSTAASTSTSKSMKKPAKDTDTTNTLSMMWACKIKTHLRLASKEELAWQWRSMPSICWTTSLSQWPN